MSKVEILVNSLEFSGDGSAAPTRLPLVMSGGIIEGADGRVFRNSDPEQVVGRFRQRGMMIPVDVEHSTQHQGAKGLPAPAVGWVRDLEVEEGGAIVGIVDWTEEGKSLIESRKYKYYSPAYAIASDGTIYDVVSVGLTNVPNLPVPALNQADEKGKGEDMEIKVVCNALGIKECASESEALVELNSIKTSYQQALNRAESAEKRLADIEKESLQVEINAAVDKAIGAGKVTPAQKAYFLGTVRTREELNAFSDFADKTAPVMPKGSVVEGKPEAGKVSLNADEQKVVAQLGVSEEEYLKAKEA